jgi:hypothetical protein
VVGLEGTRVWRWDLLPRPGSPGTWYGCAGHTDDAYKMTWCRIQKLCTNSGEGQHGCGGHTDWLGAAYMQRLIT